MATCTLTEVSKRQLQAHCANWSLTRIIIKSSVNPRERYNYLKQIILETAQLAPRGL